MDLDWRPLKSGSIEEFVTQQIEELPQKISFVPDYYPRNIVPLAPPTGDNRQRRFWGRIQSISESQAGRPGQGTIQLMGRPGPPVRFEERACAVPWSEISPGTVVGFTLDKEKQDVAVDIRIVPGLRESLDRELAEIASSDRRSDIPLLRLANVLIKIEECAKGIRPEDQVQIRLTTTNTAFRILKTLGVNKRMATAFNRHSQAYLDSLDDDTALDMNGCLRKLEDLLRRAYSPERVPINATQTMVSALVLNVDYRAYKFKRDDAALKAFLIRNFLTIVSLDLSHEDRLMNIREQWEKSALRLCPETAQEAANTDPKRNLKKLRAVLSQIPASQVDYRKVKAQLEPFGVKDTQAILQPLKALLVFRRPSVQLRSSKNFLDDACELAFAQVRNLNFEGALETLKRILDKDVTNGGVWYWSGYVRAELRQYEDALREFRYARNYTKGDEDLAWNTACCEYYLGKPKDASDLLSASIQKEHISIRIALAWEAKQNESLLDLLIHTIDPALLVSGFFIACELMTEQWAQRYLRQLNNVTEALLQPFQPPPADESLTEDTLQQTLAYFLRYGLIQPGMEYFEGRLRRQSRHYLVHRGLAQLHEASGNIDEAAKSYAVELECTQSSQAPFQAKHNTLKSFLEFCVAHHKHTEGSSALQDYGNSLGTSEQDAFKLAFGVTTEVITFPGPLKATVRTVSPGAAPSDLGIDSDNIVNSKLRLGDLNLKVGRLDRLTQLDEEMWRNLAKEYCDCLEQGFGHAGSHLALPYTRKY